MTENVAAAAVVVAAVVVVVVVSYCVPFAEHLVSNLLRHLEEHAQLPSTGSSQWKASASAVLAEVASLFPEN